MVPWWTIVWCAADQGQCGVVKTKNLDSQTSLFYITQVNVGHGDVTCDRYDIALSVVGTQPLCLLTDQIRDMYDYRDNIYV